jgi:hypothetical protein
MIYTCLCNLKHLILLIILGFLVLIIKVIQMLTGCTCMWPQFLFYFKWIINDYMLFVVLMPCLDYSLPIITGVKLMTRNCKCNYGHPKMADVESDKNLFCRLNCILNGTCIGTIVIYEFITRKSQITTEKCIVRNDRWFAYLHIQNGGSKIIWILTYSWTGNFLLAWAGQISGIENQTMPRFEQYLKILQHYNTNSYTMYIYIYIYITNLVYYTYFHWFFSPECQHVFGKQTGYIFQSSKTIKTWTTKHYASLNQWYNTE